jgi:EAL domain-containing protein (putative c-di-GMP-specific phosphodiesterase class I)
LTILRRLRGLGARIALDDFGTGQSSLGHLRNFSFDKIKIDQSFVSEMSVRDDCRAIVAAVAGLGKALGVVTTAEGVETEDQLEQVLRLGCTEAQGFLFSRPRPLNELQSLLFDLAPPNAPRNAGSARAARRKKSL